METPTPDPLEVLLASRLVQAGPFCSDAEFKLADDFNALAHECDILRRMFRTLIKAIDGNDPPLDDVDGKKMEARCRDAAEGREVREMPEPETGPPRRETVRDLDPTLPKGSGAPRPIDPRTGQHEDYWILSAEERAKGFVRPVRCKYIHDKCGTETIMSLPIAETYARDPKFYGATFCCHCRRHFYVSEFVWSDSNGEKVGS